MIKKAVSALIFLFLIACPQNVFADEHRKIVPANEILENLSKGEPVYITKAVIMGKLNISEADPKIEEIDGIKVVRSKIYIVDSVFQDGLYLPGLYFEKQVDFHKTEFGGLASFDGSEFNEGAIFSGANFTEKAIFYNVEFNDIAQFDGTNFLKRANFYTATFRGRAWFKAAQFRGEADFNKARFNETHFNGSRFYDKADFRDAQFNGNAYFNVDFNKYVQFDGEALFTNATFGGKSWFRGARFRGEVDFDGAQFNGNVSFSGTQFETMKIRWNQIEGKFDYPGHDLFYLALIKNFKELGQFEDADAAYYDYRVKKREYMGKWYRRLEIIILDWSCGYGTKPFRAIGFGLFIILFFSGFYCQKGAIQEGISSNLESSSWWKRFPDALYFSVTTFTTVGYGDWYPKGRYRYLAMFEGLLGWLIMALFLITLTKVWIR